MKATRSAPRRTGRARLVARRRRFLLSLLAIASLTLVLAAAGVMSWWWQLVDDLAVVGFVVHLRAEAKRARAVHRRTHARPADVQPTQAMRTEPVEAVDVPVRAQPAASVASHAPMVIDEETWEPVPVPLPTYVTAPVAERPEPAPIVDHEPLFDQEQWQDDEDFADFVDVRDDELADIVDRRRAVND